jgi:hypothetical protein
MMYANLQTQQFRPPMGSEYWTGCDFRGLPKEVDEAEDPEEQGGRERLGSVDQEPDKQLNGRKSTRSSRRHGL